MTDPKIPAPDPCAQISGGLLQWYFPPADAYYPVDAKYLRGLHMLITLESAETYAAAREAAARQEERETQAAVRRKLLLVLHAAVALVRAPSWAGISDEDCELERVLVECGYLERAG